MSEIATSKREDGTHIVSLEGFIGEDYWSGGGNTAAAFKAALAKVPRNEAVTVSINSEGGSIQEGLGIYNAIRERKNVTTRVDGYALSIASLIAISGDKVISPKASVWMIHNPWSITAGDSEEHRRAAESLDVNADVLAGVMSEKTGKSKEEILEAMKAETWFSGEQAVEYGLADAMTDEPVKVAALARTYRHPMSFDRTKVILNNFRAPKPEKAEEAKKKGKRDMEQLLAVLAGAKAIPSVKVEDADAAVMAQAFIDGLRKQVASLETELTTARESVKAAQTEIANREKSEAECAVEAAVKAGRFEDKPEIRATLVKAYLGDKEGTKSLLASAAPARKSAGAAPLEDDDGTPDDNTVAVQFAKITDPVQRAKFYKEHREKLISAAFNR